MSILSGKTIHTLREFWTTLSGWNDISQFGKMFLYILRKPFSNTVKIFNQIEARDSFKFLVQSFVIFTIITSLFTAFRGNDLLKGILQMLNQLFFLTLATLLYYILFNKISKIKRSFTDFLILYSLYMGFILPFFAIGSYFNWQLLLIGTDPTIGRAGPNPFKFFTIISGSLLFTVFGIYYSSRIIKYFWNIHFGMIFLGMGLVFVLLSPIQILWIKLQCTIGIVPDFEFNNQAHKKAALDYLGCKDNSCISCLLTGEWKLADLSIEKERQALRKNLVSENETEKFIAQRKSVRLNFREDGRYIVQFNDQDLVPQQYSTPWFISEDGKKVFFETAGYEILSLSKDFVSLKFETVKKDQLFISYDTMYLRPANY